MFLLFVFFVFVLSVFWFILVYQSFGLFLVLWFILVSFWFNLWTFFLIMLNSQKQKIVCVVCVVDLLLCFNFVFLICGQLFGLNNQKQKARSS